MDLMRRFSTSICVFVSESLTKTFSWYWKWPSLSRKMLLFRPLKTRRFVHRRNDTLRGWSLFRKLDLKNRNRRNTGLWHRHAVKRNRSNQLRFPYLHQHWKCLAHLQYPGNVGVFDEWFGPSHHRDALNEMSFLKFSDPAVPRVWTRFHFQTNSPLQNKCRSHNVKRRADILNERRW